MNDINNTPPVAEPSVQTDSTQPSSVDSSQALPVTTPVTEPVIVPPDPTIPAIAPEPASQPASDIQPEATNSVPSEPEPIQQITPAPETASPVPEEIPEVIVPSEPVKPVEPTQTTPPEAPAGPTTPSAIPVPLPVPISPASSSTQTHPQPTHSSQSKFPTWDWRAMLVKAREKIQFRKKARLEKIMKLAMEKKSISNNQVQLLLRVSDSTARNYLKILVKNGRLRAVGSGPARRFEPIQAA